MASDIFRIVLPGQATSPPDVVAWLTSAVNGLEKVLWQGQAVPASAPDRLAILPATAAYNPLRRDQVLYGPIANLPATLPPGTAYLGWD